MRQDGGDGIGGAAMEKEMAAVERKPRSRIDAEIRRGTLLHIRQSKHPDVTTTSSHDQMKHASSQMDLFRRALRIHGVRSFIRPMFQKVNFQILLDLKLKII